MKKKWIDEWIASKNEDFFNRGIYLLLKKWEKVIAGDGQHFE